MLSLLGVLEFWRIGDFLEKSVVELAHQLARLDGELHFLFDVLVAGVHQKGQAGVFLFQVLEEHDLRVAVGAVVVVDVELFEIGDHDPARILVVGQVARVAPGLLVGRHKGAVRLLIALREVDILSLLLDEDAGFFDVGVDEAGVGKLHRQLKGEPLFRLLHAVYLAQQSAPKGLGLLLFVTPARPVPDKLPCCFSLFAVLHARTPPLFVYSIAKTAIWRKFNPLKRRRRPTAFG